MKRQTYTRAISCFKIPKDKEVDYQSVLISQKILYRIMTEVSYYVVIPEVFADHNRTIMIFKSKTKSLVISTYKEVSSYFIMVNVNSKDQVTVTRGKIKNKIPVTLSKIIKNYFSNV